MSNHNVKNYIEQGGERTVIGGELDVVTGGSLKLAGTAIAKTAAQINALPVVEQAAEADTKADYAAADTGSAEDIAACLNVIAGKINATLAKLRLANIIAE